MYETYVPIAETSVERKPPTIADIVRQKTDDGARIIDFFLDLMEGKVDDAKLCHRIDAAKQLVKYGSKKAADFLAEHGDEPCDHCESRKRGPRPRKDQSPPAGPPYAAPHLTPDFLTLLTEDFFAVLTAVDEDLMIKLVRGQTRDGDAIVEFLDDVMHGRNDSFKPNHRISAAKELISHILRDEHRSHTSGVPARRIVVPAHPSVVPAKAGTQRGGEGRSQPDDVSAHPKTNPSVVSRGGGNPGRRRGGATPTKAAICRRVSMPSSGISATRVKVRVGPTPEGHNTAFGNFALSEGTPIVGVPAKAGHSEGRPRGAPSPTKGPPRRSQAHREGQHRLVLQTPAPAELVPARPESRKSSWPTATSPTGRPSWDGSIDVSTLSTHPSFGPASPPFRQSLPGLP